MLLKMPAWVTVSERKTKDRRGSLLVITVKPSIVYPLWFGILGYCVTEITQARLECARKCMTQYLYDLLEEGFIFRIEKDLAWRLINYPLGYQVNWHNEYKRLKEERPVMLYESDLVPFKRKRSLWKRIRSVFHE
ncbi:MAG: hypothetical protein GTO40_27570 [Deltaproteobacteria bacterium]|nr:hypothetical protein [Deltaproteobacteria bacterium]